MRDTTVARTTIARRHLRADIYAHDTCAHDINARDTCARNKNVHIYQRYCTKSKRQKIKDTTVVWNQVDTDTHTQTKGIKYKKIHL